jgi:manganese efflux pump family protein
VLALLLAGVAVGLSNLAAAIGIGVTGVNARVRLQVGVVFGVFESGMPVVGLLIGRQFASSLGQAVRWPGAILLMLVGAQALVRSIRDSRRQTVPDAGPVGTVPGSTVPGGAGPGGPGPGGVVGAALAGGTPHLGRLLASGLVLSLDNLVVGFALGTYGVGIAEGAILIGAISVAMSLAGLELGGLLGRWAGHRSEQVSGLILILVGAAIAGGALT